MGALQKSPACGAEHRQGLASEPDLQWGQCELPLSGESGKDTQVQTLSISEFSKFWVLVRAQCRHCLVVPPAEAMSCEEHTFPFLKLKPF